MDGTYLDFEQAVALLKTNSSTMYKWLQSGKVPGYKLGRQWRFLKEELEAHISGKASVLQSQQDLLKLEAFLTHDAVPDDDIGLTIGALSEKLLWDAHSSKASALHIFPSAGEYQVAYRIKGGLQNKIKISSTLFRQLDQALADLSLPLQNPDARRGYIRRKGKDLQFHHQKIDTAAGARLTLKINEPYDQIPALERVAPEKQTYSIFKKWLAQKQGVIVIGGPAGSGKTTTFFSLLAQLRDDGKTVFTLEDNVDVVVEGIHQVEASGGEVAATIKNILASDADCIGLLLDTAFSAETDAFKAAYRAAAAGHLVLLHLNAASAESVLEKVKRLAPALIEDQLLIGISSQILRPAETGSARRAEYTIIEAAAMARKS